MISTAHNAGTSSRFNMTESIGLPWPCLVFLLGGKFLAFDPTEVSFRNASEVRSKDQCFCIGKQLAEGYFPFSPALWDDLIPKCQVGTAFPALGDGGGIRSPYVHHMARSASECIVAWALNHQVEKKSCRWQQPKKSLLAARDVFGTQIFNMWWFEMIWPLDSYGRIKEIHGNPTSLGPPSASQVV